MEIEIELVLEANRRERAAYAWAQHNCWAALSPRSTLHPPSAMGQTERKLPNLGASFQPGSKRSLIEIPSLCKKSYI